ncbi:MAG: glycosyltransferase [Desulfovibrio sp.]|jgi:hypothetical protein|nr:glycosyltransferase [Desulfovibrio sp.]
MPDNTRKHIRLPDFSGRRLSLPDGPEAWEPLADSGNDVLLLGLGPKNPQDLPFVRGSARVFWLDAPQTLRDLAGSGRAPLPATWREVSVDEAVALSGHCRACFYRYGRRLAPEFWGPLLGRMDAARLAVQKDGTAPPAFLPGTDRQLLHQELRHALCASGFSAITAPSPPHWDGAGGRRALGALKELLAGQKPALFLSVNFRGLDPDGEIFYLCRALGVPVAVWCVDNPWHLLCGVRAPWWREAAIFVSDASFIEDLEAAGCGQAAYLPLAAAPHMLDIAASDVGASPPLFVGRSAFQERQRFFAAARVPPHLKAKAAAAPVYGPANGPNFHWWRKELGVALWPGQEARRAGLGAEMCSRERRAAWLRAGLEAGLRVIGDEGWRELVPGVNLSPPVDYYTALPLLYRRAEAVLNVTSLLLPHSLSQRHFDVWAAGGLLLSDATPGLDLFPPELTRAVTLRRPEGFAARLKALRADPSAARDLRAAWRRLICAKHTYAHRVARIREVLGIRTNHGHIRQRTEPCT